MSLIQNPTPSPEPSTSSTSRTDLERYQSYINTVYLNPVDTRKCKYHMLVFYGISSEQVEMVDSAFDQDARVHTYTHQHETVQRRNPDGTLYDTEYEVYLLELNSNHNINYLINFRNLSWSSINIGKPTFHAFFSLHL